MPATATERLLTAPSSSPSSKARAVPMAWEAVPMPTPRATGSVMRKSLQTAVAVRFPVMPVRMMTALALPQIEYARDKKGYFLITEDYEAYKEYIAEKNN